MTSENSLVSHLIELRSRILKIVLFIGAIFLLLAPFAQELYHYLANPLLQVLPANSQMIATDVASPFFTPFKLTLVLAFFLAMPLILMQIWGFIAPGLYQREKRLAAPLMIASTVLFYAGTAFAYFVVLPLAFAFFTAVAPEGVLVATDIASYLSFVLKIFFAFGISFEIPIAIILLIWTGVTSAEKLVTKRPYIIVGAFFFGMLLTPPDVISQTLLAIPMWLLFEVGVIIGRMKKPVTADNQSEE